MKKLILFVSSFILFNSCSSDDNLFDPTYLGEGFKGITLTFDSPDVYGGDLSDWCYSDTYHILTKTDIEIPMPHGYSFGPAYPNPNVLNKDTAIRFTIGEPTEVRMYIINKDYQVLADLINDQLQAGVYEIRFNTNVTGTGVYRVVFETDKVKCTGDIWIKK